MSIRNVLIVDDSKTELMFLSEMLKKTGFAVTTAENAEDAENAGATGDPVAQRVVAAAREAGFILNATGPTTLRLAPPLIITAEQADTFVEALPQLLETVRAR